MLGLSSAFFGQTKSDIQSCLSTQKRELTSALSASGLGSNDITTSLARKLATADSALVQTADAAAHAQAHVATVVAVTLSLPHDGARVSEARNAAKTAADAVATAVSSVMQAKAQLHSRQDVASAAAKTEVDAYNAHIAAKVKIIEAAASAEIANMNSRL